MRREWWRIGAVAAAIPLLCMSPVWAADESASSSAAPVSTNAPSSSSEEAPAASPENTRPGLENVEVSAPLPQEAGPSKEVLGQDAASLQQTPGAIERGASRPSQEGYLPLGLGAVSTGATQTTSGIVGYKPIPDSLLPTAATPATPVTGQAAPGPGQTNVGGPVFTMGPYTLGRDDVVQIVVRGQPDFSGTYAVGHNGSIQYGFIGDVPADGLTKEELRAKLTEKLKQYVRVPAIQVTIVGFNSKAIYILGQVAHPGKYAMRGDSIKIRDAVIAAGLVTQRAALSRVHIIKSDPNDPSYKIVNIKNVLFKGKMRDNIALVNGDIIVIPTTFWGKVTGFISSLTDPAQHAGTVAALAAL